jgi:1,4-alpha-glucan branching enzyme
MRKLDIQNETEATGARWLPVRQNARGTMALAAVGRGRADAPPRAQASAEASPDRHLLTDEDIRLSQAGTHFRLYEKLGAYPATFAGVAGVQHAVWAPNAASVSVIGDFNQWDPTRHAPHLRENCGAWESFVPEAKPGQFNKYCIVLRHQGHRVDKADPFAFRSETPPKTAPMV